MIRLIINADDLGAGELTDQGIIEAYSKGVVSSASLLANGPSFASAVNQVRLSGLSIGVHLNLSEGESLTGPIAGLTNSDGRFPGKAASRSCFLTGNIDVAAVQRELFAQIEKVRKAGLQPDHLDTHQHSALFPQITAPLIAVATESGIQKMRLSQPAQFDSACSSSPLEDELALYRQLAPAMSKKFRAARIVTPDGLLGMPLLNRLNDQQLRRLLTCLPDGVWELMVHPGYFDPLNSFSSPAREKELTALTSESIRNFIQQHDIRLINFSDLPCAC